MSRLERHKARREGKITGVGKEIEADVSLDEQFEINPIVKKDEKDIRRQKQYSQPQMNSKQKDIDVEKLRKKTNYNNNNNNNNEIFDIEEAFDRLSRKNLAPNHDTQLEIMKELFSDNAKEYNNITFEKDNTTNKIMISEEELTKLLEEREKAHKKKLDKKRKKEAKQEKKKVEMIKKEEKENLSKEDALFEEVEISYQPQNIIEERNIIEEKVVFDEFEKRNARKSWPLYVVIIVLVLVLGFLVYTFFNK